MIDNLENSLKLTGLNNPRTYILTHNRFNTFIVLIFSDLNNAQIYKMPCRDSPHHKIEILMSFNCLHLFEPNEHKENYHIRKPNDENFLFEIEDKKYIPVGEKLVTFKTNGKIVNYSSDLGFNGIRFPFAYGDESIDFMLH